jgi:shikimate kinase
VTTIEPSDAGADPGAGGAGSDAVNDATERPVAFVGFMGVGKSTVGRGVAAALGREFFDIDDLIVERLGREIAELFAAGDEPLFRATEAALTAEVNAIRPPTVLALGGGAFEHDETRALLLEHALVVHLDVPLELVLGQVDQLRAGRPLLAEADEAEIASRYLARYDHYLEAPVQVPIGRDGPMIAIAAVLSELFARGFEAAPVEER